jgi:muramidase (phage lysozyme)
LGTSSLAFGNYQIAGGTYRSTAEQIGVTDRLANSQALVAVELLTRAGAIPYIEAGDDNSLATALALAAGPAGKLWASLPGGTQNVHGFTVPGLTSYFHQQLGN